MSDKMNLGKGGDNNPSLSDKKEKLKEALTKSKEKGTLKDKLAKGMKDKSKEMQGDNLEQMKKDIKTARKVAQKAKESIGAIETGGRIMMLLKLINFFKSLLAAIAKATGGLFDFFANILIMAGKGLVALGAAVGLFLGLSSTIGTAIVLIGFIGACLAVIGGLFVAIVAIFDSGPSKYDDALLDCKDNVKKVIRSIDDIKINSSEEQKKVVNEMYSVFKAIGYTDEHIAGAIGNAQTESGLDPTMLEGFYGEPYIIGPRKQAIYDDMKSHFLNVLLPAYTKDGTKLHMPTYESGGEYSIGTGLFQLTGGREKKYKQFVKDNNLNWGSTDAALAFALGPDKAAVNKVGDKEWVLNWGKKYPVESPEQAADEWSRHYEGNTTMGMSNRRKYAKNWYVQLGEMQADTTYVNSIIELAKAQSAAADANAVNKQMNECLSAKNYDNSNLARAMISYSWDSEALATGNNGTELYKTIMNAIWKTDVHWQSCDRSVAAGVRWSGTDDTFPIGGVAAQMSYMSSSSKWEKINWGGDFTKLKPGDVMAINNGSESHIVCYVGNDNIVNMRPHLKGNGPTFSIAHGSIGGYEGYQELEGKKYIPGKSRSPGLSYQGDWLKGYSVYRNTQKEKSSKFTSIASDKNPNHKVTGLGVLNYDGLLNN